ncbi:uncharacterized protein LOC142221072 [Haematobia irritans]|uniref:uncharacterized protein LOC142221072 n=1 Tax=Haematobia irritans TaxID=7368 RepID=UPI003F4F619A
MELNIKIEDITENEIYDFLDGLVSSTFFTKALFSCAKSRRILFGEPLTKHTAYDIAMADVEQELAKSVVNIKIPSEIIWRRWKIHHSIIDSIKPKNSSCTSNKSTDTSTDYMDFSSSKEDKGESDNTGYQPFKWCFCEENKDSLMIQCKSADCIKEWYHIKCLKLEEIPASNYICIFCNND